MISERPLQGYGLDSFPLAFRAFQGPGLAVSRVWDHPHSLYLGQWAELGVVVGSLPALAGLLALRRTLSRQLPEAEMSAALAASGVLIQGGVHSLVDAPLATPANLCLFLLILGLGVAAAKRPPEGTRRPGPCR